MATLSQEQHDRAVRFIAANRFPFPDQPNPSWPLHYRTWFNAPTHPRVPIPTPEGPHYPDIVIVDGDGRLREIAEVETALSDDLLPRWRAASDAADDTTETGCRHLLIYVPEGLETQAEAMLEGAAISYHAIRGIRVDEDGTVHVLPHRTLGNSKDHRPDSPPPVAADPVRATLDDDAREAVIRFLLAERFPFPGEGPAQWALDLYCMANTRNHPRRAIQGPDGPFFPAIVVTDAQDRPCKIAMVETEVGPEKLPIWRACSQTAVFEGHYKDPDTGLPAKHFLLYVPLGQEEIARALLAEAGISCAGVRGYEVTEALRVRMPAILPPVVRPGS